MGVIRIVNNTNFDFSVDVYLSGVKLTENLSDGEVTGDLETREHRGNLTVRSFETDKDIYSQGVRLHRDVIVVLNPSGLTVFGFRKEDTPVSCGFLRLINNTNDHLSFDVNGQQYHVKRGHSELVTYRFDGITQFATVSATHSDKKLFETKVMVTAGSIHGVVANSSSREIVFQEQAYHDVFASNFSVQSYMGKWYQIGDIPQFYEQGCARAVAVYTLLKDRVKVFNRCYDKQWNLIRGINGKAVANQCQAAELTVSFPGIPTFGSNYIVHDVKYSSYVLVGSPNRTSLYILSRDSKLCQKTIGKLLRKSQKLGYNIERFQMNYHTQKRC